MRCSVASRCSAHDPSRLRDAESAGIDARPDLWRDAARKKAPLHLQLNSFPPAASLYGSIHSARQAEGPQRELLVLTRERRVLVLQVEALRAEAQRAEGDLQRQYCRHQAELRQLREESLRVRTAATLIHIQRQQIISQTHGNLLL